MQGSASIKDGNLCVTLVNSHPSQAVELDIELRDGRMEKAEMVTLKTADIHDHNTFDRPDLVHLSPPQAVQASESRLRVALSPASVTRILGKLG